MQQSRHIDKVDRYTWVVRDHTEDQHYMVMTHSHGSDRVASDLRITIGVIDDPDLDPDPRAGLDPMVVFSSEVWSGSVNTVHPPSTVRALVVDFFNCRDLSIPIELAYQWGGTVCNQPVAVTTGYTGLIQ